MMLNSTEQQNLKNYIENIKPTLGGKLLFKFLPFRKKLVLQNMQLVFGEILDQAAIQKLALGFYSHLFSSLKESISLRFMTQTQIKQRAIVIGEKHLANKENTALRGTLVLTGHFGNWEFAPLAGILNFKAFKKQFFFVRKTQSIKLLEKIFFKRYFDAGLGIIPKKHSLTQVYQKLENNQVVVMVMDQHAKGKEGILVDFFGQKTGTYRTVAMIARDTGSPVIPARSYRKADGHHVLEFFPPLPWLTHEDPAEEIYLNTRQYNKALEKIIIEYPDQWLWMYKRWKENKVVQ